jgi:hypothetical protein
MIDPDLKDFLRSGGKIAAQLPSTRPDHHRFVQVRGLVQSSFVHPDYGKPATNFRVMRYDVHQGFEDEYASIENLRDCVIEIVEWDVLEQTVRRLAGAEVELSRHVDPLY